MESTEKWNFFSKRLKAHARYVMKKELENVCYASEIHGGLNDKQFRVKRVNVRKNGRTTSIDQGWEKQFVQSV